MKKFLFITAILMLSASAMMQAQDIITRKSGEDIRAKILEVAPDQVSYKKFDNQDGPTFIIKKSDILMITYENGEREVVKNSSPYSDSWRETPEGIVAGMRYRDYKDLYSPSDYSSQAGDPNIPALSGVCSFLIPGLGQMICGEVGRGFAWLGGAAASCAVIGIGTGLSTTAIYNTMATGEVTPSNTSGLTTGGLLVLAGTIGLLAVDIAAIVDAVKVAKIKNMYIRDTRGLSSLDIQLNPYIASTAVTMANPVQQPVAGLSMKIQF